MSFFTERQSEDVLLQVKESANKFAEAVEKKFDVKLDSSEISLYIVDTILTLFFKERRASDLAITLIGSYVGELVIHNLGGEWVPKDLAVVKIGKMKGEAHPFKQARKRLEKGLGEALTSWYAKIKMNYCQDGELRWNGQVPKEFAQKLIERDWDLCLLKRLLDLKEKQYVREEAAVLLGRLNTPRVGDALLKGLFSSEHAYFACIALQGIKEPQTLPRLRELSHDKSDVAVRIQAIQALGEHQDHESTDSLTDMLNDEDEIICHYASQALAKIGGECVLKGLLEIMGNQRQGNKLSAISALELLGDRSCIPYIISNLFEEKEAIREAATRALQYIPDARAVSPLLLLLEDESSRIRILAAYALVFVGDPQALEPMRKLLKDDVKDVREHAAYLVPLLEAGTRPAGFCW